jgi:hypothetical protein
LFGNLATCDEHLSPQVLVCLVPEPGETSLSLSSSFSFFLILSLSLSRARARKIKKYLTGETQAVPEPELEGEVLTVTGLRRLTTATSLPDPLSRDPLADRRLDGGQSGLDDVICGDHRHLINIDCIMPALFASVVL